MLLCHICDFFQILILSNCDFYCLICWTKYILSSANFLCITFCCLTAFTLLSCTAGRTVKIPSWLLNETERRKCPGRCDSKRCHGILSPCDLAECPSHPNAGCRVNECFGCNYYFVDNNGVVIDECTSCETFGNQSTTTAPTTLSIASLFCKKILYFKKIT